MIRTFVYGSCVARDTFEVLRPLGYDLHTYVARQSLLSVTAGSAATPDPPQVDVASPFQGRMLLGDWEGNLLPLLDEAADDLDLLLWDLCDERLGVRVTEGGHVSTRSVDSVSSGWDAAHAPSSELLAFGSPAHLGAFAESLHVFRSALAARGLLGRLIVVAPPWAELTTDGTPAPASFGWESSEANAAFVPYYDAIREVLGAPVVGTSPGRPPLADPGHRWGLAPFHYDPATYDTLAGQIHQLASGLLDRDSDTSPVGRAVHGLVPTLEGEEPRRRAQAYLETGRLLHPRGERLPAGDLLWRSGERTLARYVHGFLFLGDWHETVLKDDPRALPAVQAMLVEWMDLNPAPPGSHEMAYHDETTAQRVMQWTHLRDDHADRLDPDVLARLDDALTRHVELLLDPAFHAGQNNHGMFQDMALLRVARSSVAVPDDLRERCVDTAVRRLDAYFTACFTPDGVHNENSPGYHLMVSAYLAALLPVFAELAPHVATRLHRIYAMAEEYATHVIMPNGYLPPISDTPPLQVRRSGHASTFTGPAYRYSVSGGAQGQEPATRTTVFTEAGYALHRTSWTGPSASYLLFKAGYTANYHHHADDLSLLLYAHGRLLLTEAGPFGYERTDPRTAYAFSQYAHSTVVVDGRSQPRVDPVPGGVALAHHEDSDAALEVTGTNARSEGRVHTRHLRVEEDGDHLSVTVRDTVEHDDEEPHRYEVRWHVDPDARVVLRNVGAEIYVGAEKVMELTWEADSALRTRLETAQHDPVRALRFPNFGREVPGAAIVVSTSGPGLRMTTAITTDPARFRLRDWGVGAASGPWRRFDGEVPVNYLLEEVPGATHLAVVFSAMAPAWSFTYNYHRPLQGVHCHRLFVLDDFAEQGAYFAALRRDDTVFRTVQTFLRDVAAQLGVGHRDVHAVGSSKGGTAALLHGTRLPVGHVLVGAPQTRVGFFLRTPHPNVLTSMAGGTTPDDVAWADQLLFTGLRESTPRFRGEIDLMIGDKDHHYRDHLPPLRPALASVDYREVVLPGVTHGTIGPPFSAFVASEMTARCGGLTDEGTEAWSVHADTRGRTVRGWVASPPGEHDFAFHLHDRTGAVVREGYAARRAVSFGGLGPGNYRVRAFRRVPGTGERQAMSSDWVTVTR